jgi:predicted nucleic acid-binding protein
VRFADTSFWIGLQVPRDHRHDDAVELWGQSAEPIRTSNLVLGETWTFLTRRAGHAAAVRFLELVGQSRRVSVAVVDEAADSRAWAWLRLHDERVYSYVDATSFEIMRRERIGEALAFDGDFAAAGFVEARPSA